VQIGRKRRLCEVKRGGVPTRKMSGSRRLLVGHRSDSERPPSESGLRRAQGLCQGHCRGEVRT
jgi:hypothetical protein